MAGGNNLLVGKAPANTPDDIVASLKLLYDRILKKSPTSKILLLHVFPRGQYKTDSLRIGIEEINCRMRTALAGQKSVTLLDITSSFLNSDKTISVEIMPDYVHLTRLGYRIWAEKMEPVLSAMFDSEK